MLFVHFVGKCAGVLYHSQHDMNPPVKGKDRKMNSRTHPEAGSRRRRRSSRSLAEPDSTDLEALIRRRAFQIYEHRGTQPGDALNDWYQAEAEIRAAITDAGLEDV